jgi:UDP-N-acetyl-2-amino-2-deoxyglucuronate dehydrogenase
MSALATSAVIGFGIVGAGLVARFHARAIAATPGAHLAAVCRADASRAAEAAAGLGVPCEASLEALLERPDVDAVCLCTPSGQHAEQAIAAARAGKHVLVEKPMALNLSGADVMIAACRDAGVRLGVAFQRRTDPALRALHDAIRAGELGRLVAGSATVPYFRPQSYYDSAAWRGTWSLDGGGALMNQGIHLVDLLLWLMGGEVEVVGASGGTADHKIEVEDHVVAALRFASGAGGTVVATTAAAPGFPHRVEIYGTRGGAQIEGDALVRWETHPESAGGTAPRIRPQAAATVAAGSGASPTGIGTLGHTLLVQDFVAAIREGRAPLVDGTEGRRSLALVLDIYQAAGLGSSFDDKPDLQQ